MPSVENHVKFCVKEFGEENRELCYMVNSWMDAPSRELGGRHRIVRHDLLNTWQTLLMEHSCYENKMSFEDLMRLKDGLLRIDNSNLGEYFPKSKMIFGMIIQHLKLDGILTPRHIAELQNEPLKVKVVYGRDVDEKLLIVRPIGKKKAAPLWRRIAKGFGKNHEAAEELELSSLPVLTFEEFGRLMYYRGYFTQEELAQFSAAFQRRPEPPSEAIRNTDDLLKFLRDRGVLTKDSYEKLITVKPNICRSFDPSMEPAARERYAELVFLKTLLDAGLITQKWHKRLTEATRTTPLSDEERKAQEICKELIELGVTSDDLLKTMLIKEKMTQEDYESHKNLVLADYDFFRYLLDSGAITQEQIKDLIELLKSEGITREKSK
ncbi:hypothetical protein GTO27_12695 [Candidatus Bathyarchaeota archaeon]|nr:hypothetical protein [Candidatus Bathyarchaeota archaeon]